MRFWRHVHTKSEEECVAKLARQNGLPVCRGCTWTPEFERTFVEDWAPDLCLIAMFGQLVPKRLFTVPRMGGWICEQVLPLNERPVTMR